MHRAATAKAGFVIRCDVKRDLCIDCVPVIQYGGCVEPEDCMVIFLGSFDSTKRDRCV